MSRKSDESSMCAASIVRLASILCLLAATLTGSHPVQAGTYGLRTSPEVPTAGQPFQVLVDSGPCESYFVGNPSGTFDYGGVTLQGTTIEVRFGASEDLTCNIPPAVSNQTVSGLPAGTYTLTLTLQSFPPPAVEFPGESITLQVAPGSAGNAVAAIPIWNTGIAAILVALIAMGAWLSFGTFRRN
jgi:hypothetical protein